jgi:hypothetical protein
MLKRKLSRQRRISDLKTAQVDLNHAYMKAPISGRVDRAELLVTFRTKITKPEVFPCISIRSLQSAGQ